MSKKKPSVNIAPTPSTSRPPSLAVLVTLLVVCTVGITVYISWPWLNRSPMDVNVVPQFVGRGQCIECHQQQAELFTGSHHDRAMEVASLESVQADFNNVSLEHHGQVSKMYRVGDRFMVNTEGPDGKPRDYEIKYVFGTSPLQQYMVEIEPGADPGSIGRVQVLRETWDSVKKEWYYLSPPDVDGRLDPNDPLHWLGSTQCWNTSCAECHSTSLRKNFDAGRNRFSTTFAEIDVSCEACHGPGSLHVQLARQSWRPWNSKVEYGLNKLKNVSNVAQVETCAPCHSRRNNLLADWKPGEPFDARFRCQLIEHPIYARDGQIRDEDYVYGSFIQSKMFHKGIKCTDCHDPHSLKIKFPDNQLCTSCHLNQHPASKYDSPEHHFHQVGSTGAQCVACHMPETTYMEVDQRRDHSFRVPRPDLSVDLGTPNACTGCHLDKQRLPEENQVGLKQYLDWIVEAEKGNQPVAEELMRVNQAMDEAFQKWYGNDNPNRTTYYEDLARLMSRAVTGESSSTTSPSSTMPTTPMVAPSKGQLDFLRDPEVPSMIRASGMNFLGTASDEVSLGLARQGVRSPEAKLVLASIPRLEQELFRRFDDLNEGGIEILNSLVDLLDHTALTVRIEAARVLLALPNETRAKARHGDFNRRLDVVVDEWRQSLLAQSDHAESHLILGDIHSVRGHRSKAIESFRTAMRVGPNLPGSRASLATLLEEDLERLIQEIEASGSTPNESQSQRLAQLESEVVQLRKAENQLLAVEVERSVGFPIAHQIHYRYAMSCHLVNDESGLEKHLLIAHQLQPANESYLMALVAMYQEKSQFDRAVEFAELLVRISPTDRVYQQQLDELKRMQRSDPVK